MNLLLHLPHRPLLEEEELVGLISAPITAASLFRSLAKLPLQSTPSPLTLINSWEGLGDLPESVSLALLPQWSEYLSTSLFSSQSHCQGHTPCDL